MRKISLFNSLTFLSAFLLFQIELIISKLLLPNFGGSYLVWGAAVVFFQAALLLGYFFSCSLLKKIGIKFIQPFYLILYVLPLFCFPGRSLAEINAVNPNIPLVVNVFWQLGISIGPVFFVLSTTSVIAQSWLANSDLAQKNNPYALFALSNLGAFVALATYPFLEIFLDLSQQLQAWRVAYFLLVGLVVLAGLRIKASPQNRINGSSSAAGVEKEDCWRWLFFSAAGVVMFLAVTNILTYEIAPVPLLWIMPLGVYLISFVLNFKSKSWLPSWVEEKFYLCFAWSVVLFFIAFLRILPFVVELFIFCFFLFHFCMFCQAQLNKTKPVNPDNLPLFYLIIAGGGFLGGIITSWVIPLLSTTALEYLLGLVLAAAGLAMGTKFQKFGRANIFYIIYICLMLLIWPLAFPVYNLFGIIIIFLSFKICYFRLSRHPRAMLISMLMILLITPFIDSTWNNAAYIYRHRNYYGIYKVYTEADKVILMHGTTVHGAQYKDKTKENQPLTYYHKLTPVGKLLGAASANKNIGVIGLGTGCLSAYAQANQKFDYFEIDPDMYYIARNLFTYLTNSAGKINFIFGDARIKLSQSRGARYDILVVDAFSADAIPVHLLTVEAINEYRRHLAPGGIVLFHISNRYLDFIPVLFSNANYLNAYACYQRNRAGELKEGLFSSIWFALSWERDSFNRLVNEFKWSVFVPGKHRLIRPWTDKYSDMLLIIRSSDFLDSLKHFEPFCW